MKLLSLFAASLLAGHVSAFHGQLASSGYIEIAGAPADTYQWIYLTDYATGSTYAGTVEGGWNNCADQQCWINMYESSSGGYDFGALVWRTSDGCHNIDFRGALDSGHGYCCGSLPCDITA